MVKQCFETVFQNWGPVVKLTARRGRVDAPHEAAHPPQSKTPLRRNVPPLAVTASSPAYRRRWVAGVAIFGVCLAFGGVVTKLRSRPEPTPIRLEALDQGSQLRIQWDPNSEPIRRATAAKLFITDGAERLFVALDSARLRRGTVSYTRRTGRVDLRLALIEPDGHSVEQVAAFVGTPPQRAEQPLEASVQPVAPPVEPPAPAPVTAGARAAALPKPAAPIQHRARTKPLQQSGTHLPFTCLPGDVFRKTDAPAGWNTFTCRSKNVWSLTPTQSGEADSTIKANPSATKLTAIPANPSTM